MVDSPWKVQQYCYFWLASDNVTAEQITERLGLEPDWTVVKGSRLTAPHMVPAAHSWQVRCERHGRIDEQASTVLARIAPATDRVRALVDTGDVSAGLMMVRYFDDAEGGVDGEEAMGWALAAEQVQLLAWMGARIESDEYALGDSSAAPPP